MAESLPLLTKAPGETVYMAVVLTALNGGKYETASALQLAKHDAYERNLI